MDESIRFQRKQSNRTINLHYTITKSKHTLPYASAVFSEIVPFRPFKDSCIFSKPK